MGTSAPPRVGAGIPESVLFAGVLLCALAALTMRDQPASSGGGTAGGGSADPFAPTWRQPGQWAGRIDAANATRTRAASAAMEREESKALRAQAELARDHMFRTAPIPAKTSKELAERLSVLVDEAWMHAKGTRFVALGAPLEERCMRGIQQLQRDVKAGKLTTEQAKHDPDINTYQDYRKGCGKLIPHLLARKVMKPDLTWAREDGPLVTRLLLRFRWATYAARLQQPQAMLTREEWIALTRWRVYTKDAFEPMTRLRLAAQSSPKILGEHPMLAAARIAHEDKKDDEMATRVLTRLLRREPKNAEARALLESITKTSSTTPR